ncbi:uncharacterized protein LOC110460832 [Mizuhopecten yessoensis]|uniref:Uncharacterized protein n=1 Tax=Mizuhopecten yessoensis TaxID=6573 RepID=A0A210Q1I7_MIZYE|nr:uncharacterized protein LOC110460832 [Mizuhopecten yessoensis]OWF42610.1 hypothetical protein KP79_PYT10216 [Mizuhopecten yessoensis]
MRGYYSERPAERTKGGQQDSMMANRPCQWVLLLVLLTVLVLAIVAFATPYWAYISLTGNTVAFNFGFFDVCQSNTCSKYLTFFNLERYSGEMVGCILFMLLAMISLTLSLFFCFSYACVDVLRDCYRGGCGSDKQKILACACFTLLGGICELVSVVWFYINTIRNYNGLNTFRFLVSSTRAEYSLILASVSGGLAIVVAFLLFLNRFMMHYDDDEYYEDYPRKRTRHSPEPERRYVAPPPPPPAPRHQPKLGASYVMPDPVRLPDRPISMAPAAYRQKYGDQAPQVFRYTFKNDDDFWRYDTDKENPHQDNGYRVYNGDRGNRY